MITLIARRTIRATPDRLFEAWTTPSLLRQWWGPAGVECIDAHVDLRVGGRYRIANRFDDGHVVWISGQFERIQPPSLLVYTWHVEPNETAERVTVQFEPADEGTTVVVLHERIADEPTRDLHDRGWRECLDGLQTFAEIPTRTG